jgi:hypothetical protein
MICPYLDRTLLPLVVAPAGAGENRDETHGRDHGRGRKAAAPTVSRVDAPAAKAKPIEPAVTSPRSRTSWTS